MASARRIVHISTVHRRSDVRIFVKECVTLAESGYEVIFVVADGLGRQVERGVGIVDVGRPRNRVDRILRIRRKALRLAASFDAELYHLHDPELLFGARILRCNGAYLVFDAHEDLPVQILSKEYLPSSIRPVFARVARGYQRMLLKQATAIVAATPLIGASFARLQCKVAVVRNLPQLSEFACIKADSSTGGYLVYVGGIERIRGICEVVQSLSLIDETVRLRVAGEFYPFALRAELEMMPGWNCVSYEGFLTREGIARLLGGALAGLVTLHPKPNYLDALPVKMFEYMAAGIPVVGSDFPLWREILSEYNCGICVNPLEPSAIAAAIKFLLADPERAKAMGRNGRFAIESRYNWGVEAEVLRRLYTDVLGNQRDSVAPPVPSRNS